MFRSKLKVAAGVFAGTMLAGGLAFAAIPGTDGTITACYTKYGGLFSPQGSLRVVNSPSECRSNEVALNWNQKGQPGPTGPAGQDGLNGQAGLDGEDGLPGPVGPAGRDGIDGQNGVNGQDGQDGLPGPVGPVGPAGPAGISGAKFGGSPPLLGDIPLHPSHMSEMANMDLPAGSWVVFATAHITYGNHAEPGMVGVICELRSGTGWIGGAQDARPQLPSQLPSIAAIPMNGGAFVASGTGEISLWCQGGLARGTAQLIALKIGGFL